MPSPVSFGRTDDRERASAATAHPRPEMDDAALMELVQAGNREALGLVFDRYSALIRKVGTRILRDNGEAEDLVQEVFLYVHRKSHVFDPAKGQLVSWLMQIAYSRAFNRRERMKASEAADYARIEELADRALADDPATGIADELASRDTLAQAMNELSEAQRETLHLYFYEGYSLREIASRRQENHANTRHHYYRGIEKLKEVLRRLDRCRLNS